jgi:hypothetical protein
MLDTRLGAPVEDVGDLAGADAVAVIDVVEAHGAGPAPIAVQHDRHMLGSRPTRQPRPQPPFVGGIHRTP